MFRTTICFFLAFLLPFKAFAEVQVLVTIKPLELLVKSVLGNAGTVSALMPADSSPHHYNLSPSDRVAIEAADLIVYVGEELETQFDSVVKKIGSRKSVLELLSLNALTRLPLSGDSLRPPQQEEGRYDPHIWLGTDNSVLIADAIRNRLTEIVPERAEDFTRNYDLFRDKISRMETPWRNKIQALPPTPYIIYHDAIAYFELQFEFRHSLTLVADPEISPGMRRISEVREQISTIRPSCLFTDESSNEAVIRTMLSGHQIKTVQLDLLGRKLNLDQGYEHLIENLVNDIVSCF